MLEDKQLRSGIAGERCESVKVIQGHHRDCSVLIKQLVEIHYFSKKYRKLSDR